MILHLVLKHHWFDEIAAGRKRVEYRAITGYWRRRIWVRRGEIKSVRFARGYTSITLTFPVRFIDVGPCPYPDFDGDRYRIHFGEGGDQ